MHNKRILEYFIVTILIGIVLFCGLYYSFQYDSLKPHQQINYQETMVLVWMSIFFSISIIYNPIMRWYKRNKNGKLLIVFDKNINKFRYVITLFIVIAFGFIFRVFISYPGFIPLALLIIMSHLLIVQEIPELFEESGITSNGIKYKDKYYLWGDIESYSIQEENKIIFYLKISKKLFWKYVPELQFHLDTDSKREIEIMLKDKIKGI